MRSVLVSTAAVLVGVLGTAGMSLTACAAPAVPVATAPVSSYNWLNGVSCTSAKDCVAVGAERLSSVGDFPLAEQWNGKSWKTLAVKLPAGGIGGQLYGVSCKSGKCVAAGQFYTKGQVGFGLAETWNGTSWSAATTAEPHSATSVSLLAISCPTASHCVATGYYDLANEHYSPLAETLNGTSWTAATPPVPAGLSTQSRLNGVSCTSAMRCVAVGQATNSPAGDKASALTDFWNGKSWTRVAAPGPGRAPTLTSVSCTSAVSCVAIGNSPPTEEAGVTLVTFADTWNGAKWSETVIAKPARSATLAGVACALAAKCLAVGNAYSSATLADKAYAAVLNGTHWSLTKTPPTPVLDYSQFRAVMCSSPTACIAVGFDSPDSFATPYSAAALWDGESWRTINPPR